MYCGQACLVSLSLLAVAVTRKRGVSFCVALELTGSLPCTEEQVD
jgi:hypothetical protein